MSSVGEKMFFEYKFKFNMGGINLISLYSCTLKQKIKCKVSFIILARMQEWQKDKPLKTETKYYVIFTKWLCSIMLHVMTWPRSEMFEGVKKL